MSSANHPAARSVHAVMRALALATSIAQDDLALQAHRDTATNVVLLLQDVPADIAAIQQLCERYEEDMRGLRDESCLLGQENNIMRSAVATASAAAEKLVALHAIELETATRNFLLANDIKKTLADEGVRPFIIPVSIEPTHRSAGAARA